MLLRRKKRFNDKDLWSADLRKEQSGAESTENRRAAVATVADICNEDPQVFEYDLSHEFIVAL
jgi:hypothetical protein